MLVFYENIKTNVSVKIRHLWYDISVFATKSVLVSICRRMVELVLTLTPRERLIAGWYRPGKVVQPVTTRRLFLTNRAAPCGVVTNLTFKDCQLVVMLDWLVGCDGCAIMD